MMKSKGKCTPVMALFLFFMTIATSGWAQRYAVEETEVEINGSNRKGQRILIQLDNKMVEKGWASFLKETSGGVVKGPSILPMPKLLAAKGIYTVEKGQIDTITNKPVSIVSKVEGTAEGTQVWWSLDMGKTSLSKTETAQEWSRGEALLQKFARSMYLQDVEQQVADAEKVVLNTQAEADRLLRQASEIQSKITRNQQRKLELEAALAANIRELEQLNKEAENNLKQQDAARAEVENMRHAVELVKAKKQKID